MKKGCVDMMSKILIIAGCSQKKLLNPAPAIELNQGQLFKAIRKLAIKNQFDLKILSGKYGLLEPDQIIEPYNQKIKTKADIKRVREIVNPTITQIWRDYGIIIVIMGKNYREVLKPFFDNKFYVVFDKRGIGGYKSLLVHYLRLPTPQLLQELKKFQWLECNEYLWSMWDFNSPRAYHDPNRPHCCFFCCFAEGSICRFSDLYPEYREKLSEDRKFIDSLPTKDTIPVKVKVNSKLSSNQKTTLSDFIQN